MGRFLSAFDKIAAWFSVSANRARLYTLLRVAGVLAVAGGLVTDAQVGRWLAVAAGVLLTGGVSLAKRHVNQ